MEFAAPIMSAAEGEAIAKAFKSWQNAVYPESRLDDILYLKKAEQAFKKYEEMDLRVVGM